MTQEEKELLLKDLCARLPYGVIIRSFMDNRKLNYENYSEFLKLNCIKPYLRPMSSMTEDEKKELLTVVDSETTIIINQIKTCNCGIMEGKYHFNSLKELDWLNAHHFDYRNLIEKGLALKAPEGMYKF